MVKRTDVQELAIEVRELRKAVRTGRNNQRALAAALGLSLLITAGLGYVYVSDRGQTADIKDVRAHGDRLEALIAGFCPQQQIFADAIGRTPRPEGATPQQIQDRADFLASVHEIRRQIGCPESKPGP